MTNQAKFFNFQISEKNNNISKAMEDKLQKFLENRSVFDSSDDGVIICNYVLPELSFSYWAIFEYDNR